MPTFSLFESLGSRHLAAGILCHPIGATSNTCFQYPWTAGPGLHRNQMSS